MSIVKEYIENGELEYLFEYVYDIYWNRFDLNSYQGEAYTYFFNRLKEIKEKHSITVEPTTIVKEFTEKWEKLKLNGKYEGITDLEKLDNLYFDVDDMRSDIRNYFASFFTNQQEFLALIQNHELFTNKNLLIKINSKYLNPIEVFKKWYNLFVDLEELSKIFHDAKDYACALSEYKNDVKINQYKDDENFYENLENIMKHDTKKFVYRYHGTQDIESAESILKHGLLMAREDLNTTSYPEFSAEQLLLYSRGFGGEIGATAVVIFKVPITNNRPEKIVKALSKKTNIPFSQSGLGGFLESGPKYIVPKEYIVGYVNKLNSTVVYGEGYTADDNLNV